MSGRRFAGAILVLLAWCGTPAYAEDRVPLPPLVEPVSPMRLPGKFIWADLFTSDLERQRDFYVGLFGWRWEWLDATASRPYGLLYNADQPVAGIVSFTPRAVEGPYARWIHYASVDDVRERAEAVRAAGGRVLLEPREMPERGAFAIAADPEAAPFGLLESKAGDPEDYQVAPGDWLWVQLFAREAGAAGAFYADLLGYELQAAAASAAVADFVLASHGYARAGVAQLPQTTQTRPLWLGFVRVAELGPVLVRATELGGTVLLPPSPERMDGGLAVLADPLGAAVGVLEWSYPESSTLEAKPR